MKLKKFISVLLAGCIMGGMYAAPTFTTNSAYKSDAEQYGDYLYYVKVDEDQDGIYDYLEITDCDESATTVYIPDSIIFYDECYELPVSSIGKDTFYNCKSLTSISVSMANTSYCSYYGALYNKDKTELITCPMGMTEITISDVLTPKMIQFEDSAIPFEFAYTI